MKVLDLLRRPGEIDTLSRELPNEAACRSLQEYIGSNALDVLDINVARVKLELTMLLGRNPSNSEVENEIQRLLLVALIVKARDDKGFIAEEMVPQQEVIARRSADFPKPEDAMKAFRYGRAEIVQDPKNPELLRLIIYVRNAKGEEVAHPVMTNEEISWVKATAKVIAKSVEKGKVFIAGLGLGLLNDELIKLGINPNQQVVAELNDDVIRIVGPKFKKNPKNSMDLRQGDFKDVLRAAISAGERFRAIMIDAYPNTAKDVNRDASSEEVLKLAWEALEPGGVLTFYPDSMFLPPRVYDILKGLGVPDCAIHYGVADFHTSKFTHKYHYGKSMGVIQITKPLLSEDQAKLLTERFDLSVSPPQAVKGLELLAA